MPSGRAVGGTDLAVAEQVAEKTVDRPWPEVIELKVWLWHELDAWYALAEEVDIVGKGDSKAAALNEMSELLCSYLDSYIAEGRPFEDAKRPIPFSEKARLYRRLLRSRLVRVLRHDWVARRRTFMLPYRSDGYAPGC
jgi:hypothetical protein